MNTDLVSIVIPFFNRERTLKRSLESVLNQTYDEIEVILVDDGSTDGSIASIKSICDSRVRIISQSNQGACIARNAGVSASTGRYIAFQDSDDEWNSKKLETQLNILQQTASDVCFCRCRRHNENGDEIDVWPRVPAGLVDIRSLAKESLVSTQTILGKREAFSDNCFDPCLSRLQDYDWVLSVCKQCKFVLADEVLVDVYLQRDSLTMSGNKKLSESFQYILEKHYDRFKNWPEIQASFLENTGRSLAMIGLNPSAYYQLAIHKNISPRLIAKYILSLMNIYK